MARGAGSQLAMKDKPVGTTPEVQSLKNMFYADVSSSASVDDMGVIHDLPLWRVQWTELPGFQNVLNGERRRPSSATRASHPPPRPPP